VAFVAFHPKDDAFIPSLETQAYPVTANEADNAAHACVKKVLNVYLPIMRQTLRNAPLRYIHSKTSHSIATCPSA